MRTAVQARTAGKQAVTVADMDHVVFGASRCHKGARAAFVPQVNVVLGVERNNTAARRAAGGLNADIVPERTGKQTVRVGVAQIGLCQEGELMQVVNRLDVFGRKPFLLHPLSVVGDVVVNMFYRLAQTFILPLADLFLRGAFDFRLEIISHG